MRGLLLFICVAITSASVGQIDTLVLLVIPEGSKALIAPSAIIGSGVTTASSTAGLEVNSLPDAEPSLSLIEGTNFTVPILSERATINSFHPAATAVQMLMFRKTRPVGQCSGHLVAPDLVLTAAHCFVDAASQIPSYDEIIVAPAGSNLIDESRMVTRARSGYVLKRYLDHGKGADIMLLKLDDPLGDHTGWIGISCRQDSGFIRNTIFHKFSFPAKAHKGSAEASGGRQLHYNHGLIHELSDNTLGIRARAANATPGQSGSSFLYFDKGSCYSIGVSIFSRMYQHQRITKSIFNAFQPVINESINSANTLPYILYPTPISVSAVLKVAARMERFTIIIEGADGEVLRTQTGADSDQIIIDRGTLERGEYIFRLMDDKGRVARGTFKVD
jgi:V8-like Glu-specific endopeptidase